MGFGGPRPRFGFVKSPGQEYQGNWHQDRRWKSESHIYEHIDEKESGAHSPSVVGFEWDRQREASNIAKHGCFAFSAPGNGGKAEKSMSKQTPKFDSQGYQTNLKKLNNAPLPDAGSLQILSPKEQSLLGLPTPEELAGNQPKTKISIAIDNDALAFFKAEAKKHKTSYQRMIRNLIRSYALANGTRR